MKVFLCVCEWSECTYLGHFFNNYCYCMCVGFFSLPIKANVFCSSFVVVVFFFHLIKFKFTHFCLPLCGGGGGFFHVGKDFGPKIYIKRLHMVFCCLPICITTHFPHAFHVFLGVRILFVCCACFYIYIELNLMLLLD